MKSKKKIKCISENNSEIETTHSCICLQFKDYNHDNLKCSKLRQVL